MMNELKFLFPDYKPGDWVLQDDGAGAYIRDWNRAEPQPTASEIAVAKPASDAVKLDKEASDTAKANLVQLDDKSIRDIRAYIAAKADAPQYLKDLEASAIAERTRVKP